MQFVKSKEKKDNVIPFKESTGASTAREGVKDAMPEVAGEWGGLIRGLARPFMKRAGGAKRKKYVDAHKEVKADDANKSMVFSLFFMLLPYILIAMSLINPLFFFAGLVVYFSKITYGGKIFMEYPVDPILKLYDNMGLSLSTVYKQLPILLVEYYQDLENQLSVKIKGKSARIFHDKDLGFLMELEVDGNPSKKYTADSLVDYELNTLFLYPRIYSFDKETGYYLINGKLYIMLDFLIMNLTQETTSMLLADNFSKKPEYYTVFKEMKGQYKKQKELEEQRAREEEARAFKEKLSQRLAESGIHNDHVLNILARLYEKREDLGFGPHLIEGGIEGNERYFTARMVFNKNGNMRKVRTLQDEIEKVIGRQYLIKELQDKTAFKLTVLMNTELPLYTRDEKLVKEEYTDKGRLFIGESLTGKLGAPINLEQANFIGIFGKSGGGKSVQGVNVSSQIVNILASGKKEESQVSPEVYIFSSSKIADFQSFAKQGAYTTVGSEGTLKLIEYLINKAKEREA